jgi:threonine/homoserine/homoserine lactone efflux protein
MEYVLPLLGIALANLLAAMSPGPSVLLVARIAIAGSRRAGLAAAAGMALGGMIWATAAIFGLALLFSSSPGSIAVQMLGGSSRLYRRDDLARGAHASRSGQRGVRCRRAVLSVTRCCRTSPTRVVVFFGSVFIALLPAHAPGWVWAATVAIITANEAAWYTTLAVSFSAAPMRRAYARIKLWLDRAVAGVLAGLGLKLVLDAR